MAKIPDSLMQNMYIDLKNERTHMLFYLTNAGSLTGLHSEEYTELFLESAKEEMNHVNEFQNMIVGLGGNLNCSESYGFYGFSVTKNVTEALKHALQQEEFVVFNYAERINEIENCAELDVATKTWLVVFYEDQLKNSRTDVDKYKRLIDD